jgi:hypothetical protein
MQAFPLRLALGFAAAAVLALGAIVVIPRDTGGDRPPESTLVAVALVVAVVMGAAVFAGMRLDLGLPVSIAVYAAGWNVLVVLVKLYLGPSALYEASETGRITTDLGEDDAAMLTAAGVGAAYLLAFWFLYRIARVRVDGRVAKGLTAGKVALGAVALVLLFVSGLPLLLLLFLVIGGEYVSFVFTTGASLVAGFSLALAVALAAAALNSTAARARAVGDATLLVTVFWVGVAYLALYHALWVVYVLLLTSLWPLKVVSSK